MANSLFQVELGFEDSNTSKLSGSAVPGGDASFQDNAPQGSEYSRTDGSLYVKTTSGTGTNKWEKIATENFSSTVGAGASWREIVLARDNTVYADITAAETAANVGNTVDSVTIVATDRILFSNLTTGNDNIYIVSGSTGAWTFTEDSNLQTSGDRVSITSGTDTGRVFYYNGTTWVFSNQSSTQEEGFIRTYTGKTAAGSETPTYSSTNVVTTGNSLESEIGALDSEIGAAVATPQSRTAGPIVDQAINLNVEALDDAIGANVTSTNQVAAASNVNVNLSSLDTKIGANVTNGIAVLAANSVHSNLQTLDTELAARTKETTTLAVTTITAVDTIQVDSNRAVKWAISATKVATETDVYASEVMAIHNGTSIADATTTDYTEYAIVSLGAAIVGLTITVTLSGIGGSQVMNLNVTSTDPVNVSINRLRV